MREYIKYDDYSYEIGKILSERLSDVKHMTKCIFCKKGHYYLTNGFVQLDSISKLYFDNPLTVGGKSLPLVVLTCEHCGNTQLFNIKSLGILKEK